MLYTNKLTNRLTKANDYKTYGEDGGKKLYQIHCTQAFYVNNCFKHSQNTDELVLYKYIYL